MNSLDIAQRYFDAWNRRDASAVLTTLAPGGTYADPTTGGPISGDALIAYINGIVSAFPDVSFEITSKGLMSPDLVAATWIMRGTNLGSMRGLPPTGKSIEVRGADFIRVADGGIRSVEGYFDSRAIPDQLGLQVLVQPSAIGPLSFGNSIRASHNSTATPGAFGITWVEVRSAEEQEKIREISRKIAQEMLALPGFISWVGATIGNRMMTITAWETPEALGALMKSGEHRSASRSFFASDLGGAASTSVWVPARINPLWVRCAACSRMNDAGMAKGKCECGAALPAPGPYW